MKVLPISLLVQDRKCLVVGGGKVAGRKVSALLEAGADVTVVSLAVCEDLAVLADEGGISVRLKAFRASDVEGFFIVLAATCIDSVNKDIIGACHTRNILCGCVDKGWRNGDFITPATFRGDGYMISVTTGGECCRRSISVRDRLARILHEFSSREGGECC